VDVPLGSRKQHVTFYGAPNDRVEPFTAMLSQGLIGQLLQKAAKLNERETADPHLKCPACPTSARHASGSTTCRHHGTGLLRWSQLPAESAKRAGEAIAGFGVGRLAALAMGSAADRAKAEQMLRMVIYRCASCDHEVELGALQCAGCGRAFAQR
jgi:hypothetical protein